AGGVVMLHQPIAVEAKPFGMPRKLQGLGHGLRDGGALFDGREIENGNRDHAGPLADAPANGTGGRAESGPVTACRDRPRARPRRHIAPHWCPGLPDWPLHTFGRQRSPVSPSFGWDRRWRGNWAARGRPAPTG